MLKTAKLPGVWAARLLCLLAALAAGLSRVPPAMAEPPAAPDLQVVGIEEYVVDVDQGVEFFTRMLGFSPVSRPSPDLALVENNGVQVAVRKAARKPPIDYPDRTGVNVNFRVGQLLKLREEMKSKGGDVLLKEPGRNALGISDPVADGSSNIFHLIEFQPDDGKAPERPRIFNVGIRVPDMDKARAFYCGVLGFEVFSEDFFPPTVPLKKKGAIALGLHLTAKKTRPADYPETAQAVIALGTADLAATTKRLKEKGVEFLSETPRPGPWGNAVAFKDPFGNTLALVARAPAVAGK
jgi:lactoylglutathione lyase